MVGRSSPSSIKIASTLWPSSIGAAVCSATSRGVVACEVGCAGIVR